MAQTEPCHTSSRLVEITLDEASLGRNAPEIEHERQIAIFDILEENAFELTDGPGGPYKLAIALNEQRLVFAVSTNADAPVTQLIMLPLTPFRSVVKDYFMVCESYFDAIKSAPPGRIEALDIGRRGVHDEGGKILKEHLEGKIAIDDKTARQLFTLLCALHWKG